MLTVDGPYQHGRRFRLRIRENGVQRVESFISETEAIARRRKLRREAAAKGTATVAEVLEAYRDHMKQKGNRARSIEVTIQRLNLLFREVLDKPLGLLAGQRQSLIDAMNKYRVGGSKYLSVDSKHNLVNQGRTFFRWCISIGVLKENLLDGVQIIGRRRRGKPQLTADEGVRFLNKALELAEEAMAGHHTGRRMRLMNQLEGSVGAACCLWLGPRASEVTDREVRDLDCNGSVLIITDAKTAAGVRRLVIPTQLQPYLRQLAANKKGNEKLFGRLADRHGLGRWVRRICQLAEVPNVPPHGLRGTHSSLAREGGSTVGAVSHALGHASTGVTLAHYIRPAAEQSAKQRRVESLLPVG